jgi:hypothetical protein
LITADFGAASETSDVALVFLGIDEKTGEQPIPYWALDVTVKPKSPFKDTLERLHQGKRFLPLQETTHSLFLCTHVDLEKADLEFTSALPQAFKLKKDVAAILAQARAMCKSLSPHQYDHLHMRCLCSGLA